MSISLEGCIIIGNYNIIENDEIFLQSINLSYNFFSLHFDTLIHTLLF